MADEHVELVIHENMDGAEAELILHRGGFTKQIWVKTYADPKKALPDAKTAFMKAMDELLVVEPHDEASTAEWIGLATKALSAAEVMARSIIMCDAGAKVEELRRAGRLEAALRAALKEMREVGGGKN